MLVIEFKKLKQLIVKAARKVDGILGDIILSLMNTACAYLIRHKCAWH